MMLGIVLHEHAFFYGASCIELATGSVCLYQDLEGQQGATPAIDHEKEKLKASVGRRRLSGSCDLAG